MRPSSQSLLSTSALTVRYGGVRAVDAVDLDVPAGALVGLVGPNGAGKTSLVDALTGLTPYSGTVALDGHPLDGLPPHARCRRGLIRTFQAVELFDDLDVHGNLLVAASRPSWWQPLTDLVRPRERRAYPAAERAVDVTGIGHLPRDRDALQPEDDRGLPLTRVRQDGLRVAARLDPRRRQRRNPARLTSAVGMRPWRSHSNRTGYR